MKLPPLQTALLSAANLLSFGGMTVAKYLRNRSACSRKAGIGVDEDDALLLQVLAHLVVDDLDSYCAPTPARYLRSASGMPSCSKVSLISAGTSSQVAPGLLRRLDVVVDVVEVDAC